MQKFIVPQFIDVESKIIGPITTRQFLIMLAGLILGFAAYKLSDLGLFVLEAAIIFILVIVFAFVKVNGAAFHIFLLNYIKTVKSAKIRIWHRENISKVKNKDDKDDLKNELISDKRRLSSSRLSELSLVVDTGGAYQGESFTIDNPLSLKEEAKLKK